VREIIKIAQERCPLETPIGEEEDSHRATLSRRRRARAAEAAAFTCSRII
jgi:DNA-directed RNA polymerase sigma subunit (sigma70/sigma32)